MTTSGATTSCADCNVDDRDVDTTPSTYSDMVGTRAYKHVSADEEDDVLSKMRVDVEEVDHDDQPTVPLAPDGGWGWMVVAASFVSNLIVGGICYMFGIIMPELMEYFQSGKGKTAFVGSLVPGTLSVVGKADLSHDLPCNSELMIPAVRDTNARTHACLFVCRYIG